MRAVHQQYGDGIHIFSDALKLIGNKELSCHTVMFFAPTKDVSEVLPQMKNSKMAIHDKVLKTHVNDLISNEAQSGNEKDLNRIYWLWALIQIKRL